MTGQRGEDMALMEAEYAELLPLRLERLAGIVTGLLPQEMHDAGLHFEFVTAPVPETAHAP
jgi:hypothetical protein